MNSVLPETKSELRRNLHIACEALLDKKAEDLKLLYFGDKSPLTDCFIIATGTSDPHLKALRNNLEIELKKQDRNPIQGSFSTRRMAYSRCN